MPTENSSPQTDAGVAGGARTRTLRRVSFLLAAIVAYLALALALKLDLAARVSESMVAARDTISDRFHKRPEHPINLNTAGADELQQLPGIGPVTAKEIIQFREQSGAIRQPEDLLALPRFTRRALNRIRPYIVVGPPSQ